MEGGKVGACNGIFDPEILDDISKTWSQEPKKK